MLVEKDEEITRLKGGKIPADSGASQEQSQMTKDEVPQYVVPASSGVDRDYIKNILVKYLEYQAKGDQKEAMTLEKVLFTVLDANPKDLSELSKARGKNNTGLLSYFYTPAQTSVAKPMKLRKQPSADVSMEFD